LRKAKPEVKELYRGDLPQKTLLHVAVEGMRRISNGKGREIDCPCWEGQVLTAEKALGDRQKEEKKEGRGGNIDVFVKNTRQSARIKKTKKKEI